MKEPILHTVAFHPNGESYKCNSQDTMIPAMSRSNLLCQQQCQDTTFMKSPLLDNFDYLANKKFAQQVINGYYIAPPGTSEFAMEFLSTLQRPPYLEETDVHLTPEMNQFGWKKPKERTALIIITPHV